MNTEHQLKPKLTWPKCPNSMKLKQKSKAGERMSKFLAGEGRGWRRNPPPTFHHHFLSRGNPDLYSSLRFFKYFFLISRIPYTMLVMLDIKLRFANIKWDLCQSTVKFQNMPTLVDKIYTNIQTSMGYYLLNWVLASMCSCSQKSSILFSACVKGSRVQFSKSYMNSNDFAVYCLKFFHLCAW